MSIFRTLLIVLLLVGVSGFAQASDDDAQLDAPTLDLIHEGVALRRSGKDDAALGVFLDAEKHAPSSVRVLLHITAAAQATGKWPLAYQYLQKAALHRDDPYYQRYRAAIHSIEDAVAQHVSLFRAVGNPSGAEIFLNGQSIGTLPMDSPRVLETGSYVLEVKKPGYFPLRRSITLVGGGGLSQEAVQLNLNDLSASSSADGRPVSGPRMQGEAINDRSSSTSRGRWVTWTLAGTSAALFVTSGVALAIRQSDADHWNDNSQCLNTANPSSTRQDLCGHVHDEAVTAGRVAIVTGVIGLGFAGAAITHLLVTSEHPAVSSHSAGLASCAAGLGSVLCRGTF